MAAKTDGVAVLVPLIFIKRQGKASLVPLVEDPKACFQIGKELCKIGNDQPVISFQIIYCGGVQLVFVSEGAGKVCVVVHGDYGLKCLGSAWAKEFFGNEYGASVHAIYSHLIVGLAEDLG